MGSFCFLIFFLILPFWFGIEGWGSCWGILPHLIQCWKREPFMFSYLWFLPFLFGRKRSRSCWGALPHLVIQMVALWFQRTITVLWNGRSGWIERRCLCFLILFLPFSFVGRNVGSCLGCFPHSFLKPLYLVISWWNQACSFNIAKVQVKMHALNCRDLYGNLFLIKTSEQVCGILVHSWWCFFRFREMALQAQSSPLDWCCAACSSKSARGPQAAANFKIWLNPRDDCKYGMP